MTKKQILWICGITVLIIFANQKYCYWVPQYFWLARNMPHVWKKGIQGEAFLNVRNIREQAIDFYQRIQKDQQRKISLGEFPCRGQGWICSPPKSPCILWNRNYYRSLPSLWSHPCWKQLKFVPMGNVHHAQYCYRADGVGKNATFKVKATGSPFSCKEPPQIIEFISTMDEYSEWGLRSIRLSP